MKEQKTNAENSAKEKDSRIAQFRVCACTIYIYARCARIHICSCCVSCVELLAKVKFMKIVCTKILCPLFQKKGASLYI